uniref:Uncharacterized protein n=1 Tax=Glossina morsitans morsitans TaxID=37546 RepID=A0A1B0FR61_GLOMM
MLTVFKFYRQMVLILAFSCSAICKNVGEISDLNNGLNVTKNDDFKDNLKYDVEILEPYAIRKETVELEERYRAPSIIFNTDKIIDEDIDVLNTLNERESIPAIFSETRSIFVIILTTITLLIIVVIIVLIARRYRFQERYGRSELLISNDNRDYWSRQFTTTS